MTVGAGAVVYVIINTTQKKPSAILTVSDRSNPALSQDIGA